MAKVQNLEAVIAGLKKRGVKYQDKDQVSVSVGFTQNYSIFVHENLEAHHPVGQAKFLEQPARENASTYRKDIVKGVQSGLDMPHALLRGGLHLQRDSQELCPVDTGAMKNSAFTRID